MADTSAAVAPAPSVAPAQPNPISEAAAEATAPPDFRKFKHKLKINEREEEHDYDTVVKLAQKGKAADEVFRKASAKEKQMADMLDRMKAGDLDWLEEIAGDEKLTKWAEKKLLKIIERNEMSPEQRALVEERSKREKLEKELSTREEKEKFQAGQAFRDQAAQELDVSIDKAFKAASLPMTPSRIERVAQLMDASLSTTGTLLDPGRALQRVQQDMRSDAREVLESLTPAEMREFLPKKVLDAIRRGDIEDVRAQDPLRRTTQNGQPRRNDTKTKRMSTDDFFNKLEKKLGG